MSETTLFDRWPGTIRKMADDLGEKPSTVQSWKSARRIPSTKQPKVLRIGRMVGLKLTPADVVFPMGRAPEVSA